MKESIVSIETEAEKVAAKIESRVIDGRVEAIIPSEREQLREAIEAKGVNLAIFDKDVMERLRSIKEEVGRTSRQAKELEVVLGGSRQFIDYCQEMLTMCVREDKRERAKGFVEKYVAEHTKDGYLHFGRGGDLMKNRLEAIISATNALFGVVAQYSDGEAERLMTEDDFVFSLRERVLRGWEKTQALLVLPEGEITRLNDDEIRTLPVGGLKNIIEYWLR
ncbi:MAG: hypothetical protein ACD_61C00168G0003 [uncultured bacterium]|nr:MAG: hypothetical protein ACD_61C00168G0003 [uncultured bacterium]